MPVTVRIPMPLRQLTGGRAEVAGAGPTLGDLIGALDRSHPGLGERLLQDGAVNRAINVYVNDEDIRFLSGLATAVADGDRVTIVPTVAGGVA